MFQQIIRELTMIEEEEKNANNDDVEDVEDDDEIDEDVNEEEEEEGESIDEDDANEGDSKKKLFDRAKALYVPEGGYNEEEDCVNAEDEAYREALESMDKTEKVKRQQYLAGEPVDDEDDDDDFEFTSPIENLNLNEYFVNVIKTMQQRGDHVFLENLQNNLDGEDKEKLVEIIKNVEKKNIV
jgi:hypothetical protein